MKDITQAESSAVLPDTSTKCSGQHIFFLSLTTKEGGVVLKKTSLVSFFKLVSSEQVSGWFGGG